MLDSHKILLPFKIFNVQGDICGAIAILGSGIGFCAVGILASWPNSRGPLARDYFNRELPG
jgi:hypothetical protein